MSTSYSFYLRVGFEITEDDIIKTFQHKEESGEPGIFHMEDRFDPKTGARIAPEKVWDKRPKAHTKKWLEIDGQKIEDFGDNPDQDTSLLETMIGCRVGYFWNSTGGNDNSYVFYPHSDGNESLDFGRGSIHNISMLYQDVVNLAPELDRIKEKLQSLGFPVKEAKVFLPSIIG